MGSEIKKDELNKQYAVLIKAYKAKQFVSVLALAKDLKKTDAAFYSRNISKLAIDVIKAISSAYNSDSYLDAKIQADLLKELDRAFYDQFIIGLQERVQILAGRSILSLNLFKQPAHVRLVKLALFLENELEHKAAYNENTSFHLAKAKKQLLVENHPLSKQFKNLLADAISAIDAKFSNSSSILGIAAYLWQNDKEEFTRFINKVLTKLDGLGIVRELTEESHIKVAKDEPQEFFKGLLAAKNVFLEVKLSAKKLCLKANLITDTSIEEDLKELRQLVSDEEFRTIIIELVFDIINEKAASYANDINFDKLIVALANLNPTALIHLSYKLSQAEQTELRVSPKSCKLVLYKALQTTLQTKLSANAPKDISALEKLESDSGLFKQALLQYNGGFNDSTHAKQYNDIAQAVLKVKSSANILYGSQIGGNVSNDSITQVEITLDNRIFELVDLATKAKLSIPEIPKNIIKSKEEILKLADSFLIQAKLQSTENEIEKVLQGGNTVLATDVILFNLYIIKNLYSDIFDKFVESQIDKALSEAKSDNKIRLFVLSNILKSLDEQAYKKLIVKFEECYNDAILDGNYQLAYNLVELMPQELKARFESISLAYKQAERAIQENKEYEWFFALHAIAESSDDEVVSFLERQSIKAFSALERGNIRPMCGLVGSCEAVMPTYLNIVAQEIFSEKASPQVKNFAEALRLDFYNLVEDKATIAAKLLVANDNNFLSAYNSKVLQTLTITKGEDNDKIYLRIYTAAKYGAFLKDPFPRAYADLLIQAEELYKQCSLANNYYQALIYAELIFSLDEDKRYLLEEVLKDAFDKRYLDVATTIAKKVGQNKVADYSLKVFEYIEDLVRNEKIQEGKDLKQKSPIQYQEYLDKKIVGELVNEKYDTKVFDFLNKVDSHLLYNSLNARIDKFINGEGNLQLRDIRTALAWGEKFSGTELAKKVELVEDLEKLATEDCDGDKFANLFEKYGDTLYEKYIAEKSKDEADSLHKLLYKIGPENLKKAVVARIQSFLNGDVLLTLGEIRLALEMSKLPEGHDKPVETSLLEELLSFLGKGLDTDGLSVAQLFDAVTEKHPVNSKDCTIEAFDGLILGIGEAIQSSKYLQDQTSVTELRDNLTKQRAELELVISKSRLATAPVPDIIETTKRNYEIFKKKLAAIGSKTEAGYQEKAIDLVNFIKYSQGVIHYIAYNAPDELVQIKDHEESVSLAMREHNLDANYAIFQQKLVVINHYYKLLNNTKIESTKLGTKESVIIQLKDEEVQEIANLVAEKARDLLDFVNEHGLKDHILKNGSNAYKLLLDLANLTENSAATSPEKAITAEAVQRAISQNEGVSFLGMPLFGYKKKQSERIDVNITESQSNNASTHVPGTKLNDKSSDKSEPQPYPPVPDFFKRIISSIVS